MKPLSLLPLQRLNAALVSVGQLPVGDKATACARLEELISQGLISVSTIETAPIQYPQQPVSPQPAVADPRIERLAIEMTSVELLMRSALNEVSDIRRKSATLQGVDYDKVNTEIRSAVADLFAEFKQTAHQFPVQAAEVAKAFPKTRREEAQHVFEGDLFYRDDEGNLVDFSTFEVDIWDDPACPAVVSDYVFDPAALHQTLIALSTTLPHNTWLGGERGTGKTEFVTQIAARLKRKLFRINFDEGLERSEFIGSNTIENGNVVWKAGTLTQAIQYAGSIILLDEVGFARAQNISPLHAVTERSVHRALVIAETGERIPVSTGVVFFAADNSTGHGDESGNFAGVREQNSAFLDRFSFTIRFNYLPQESEIKLISKRTGLNEDATRSLVAFAHIARTKARLGLLTQPPSLRQLFAWAAAIKGGLPVSTAFNNAIVNKFPAECEAELRGIFSASIDAEKLKSYLGVK
jgi:MoxR-like ATPase